MGAPGFLVAILLLSTAASAENNMIWPDLPQTGFITGRAATNDDVAAGQALFSMDGRGEGAIAIEIPQYAIWTDADGTQHPVIVLQAENAPGGIQIVGLKDVRGAEIVATLSEVRLLGSRKPD